MWFDHQKVGMFLYDRTPIGAIQKGYNFYKDHIEGRTLEDNEFSEWLYGDYDEEKLKHFELLHNVPVVSNYMDYLLDYRADSEYLKRYGLDWTDVHDPRKLRSVGSGVRFMGAGINFVSSNVTRLYR